MSTGTAPIPITVIGGYLGAGKTTLVNELLRGADGRRLGVVVNDFGELGIDAELLQAALDGGSTTTPSDATPIVNLANGCVCCTLGDDLRATLDELVAIRPSLDHIVIEASGVADPAVAAAWGTVPGFLRGGVVVLAAADAVMAKSRDRYVGSEVVRQIAGADLVIVTKTDLCEQPQVDRVVDWVGTNTDAPVVIAFHGEIDVDVVLGRRTDTGVAGEPDAEGHAGDSGRYLTWSTRTGTVEADALDAFLDALPDGVLRAKGFVDVRDGSGRVHTQLVQVVGRTVSMVATDTSGARGLEVIGIAGVLDTAALDALATAHLDPFS
ncbi:CobW family GTP-binding protein [Ilumatobacter nonamiensis]|uniref:CobW family GTP-binding protein n=1 Tax=Ilumatobacter nonamiensis TaxID=467093 RepID=UPI00034B44BA|nr:GTP-binding protein [Ilumatobacter nonamiensis]